MNSQNVIRMGICFVSLSKEIRIRRHFMILNMDNENAPMLNIPIANVSKINSLTYSKQLLEQTV